MSLRLFVLSPVLFFSPFALIGGESEIEVSVAVDSRYVSEGRNNLESGGIVSSEIAWSRELIEGRELCLGAWYGDAWSEQYSELNLSVGFAVEVDEVELVFAYTYLDFIEDVEDDQELAFSLGFDVLDEVDVGIGMVYSDDADGVFLEWGVSREFLWGDGFAVVPFAVLGINEGYVSDEHDGMNHLNFGVESSWALSENMYIGAYLSYSIGLDEDVGESLDDLFYGGLSLSFIR